YRLPRGVLAVQPFDQVMRRFLACIVGVVAVAQKELTARSGMRSDSPAARLMTVPLLHKLVDARRDRAEDGELRDVRSDTGPESVVGARQVAASRVDGQPILNLACVKDQRNDSRSNDDGKYGDSEELPPHGTGSSLCLLLILVRDLRHQNSSRRRPVGNAGSSRSGSRRGRLSART